MSRKITVQIVGDSSGLERSFRRSKTSAEGFNSSIGRLRIGLKSLIGGTLVVDAVQRSIQGLEGAARVGIDVFAEQARVSAQTAAAIKSTGGAANVTAKQVDTLGLSLSNLSGQSKQSVEAAENALLSFTRVKNFSGSGNNIFTRATKDVVDFAARTGRDATAAAVIFGKALQDPATRVSSLARAGLVLTKSQTEAIKALERTSGVVAAQKLLLKDLEERYKGAAKAAGDTVPGQLNKLKNALSEIAGEVVGKNVTGFDSLLKVGVKWVQNADNQKRVADDVQKALHELGQVAKAVAGIIEGATPIVKNISGALGGTKRSVELLAGAIAAFKAVQLLDALGGIKGLAKGAAGEVGLLRSRLLALSKIGPIAIAIAVTIERKQIADKLDQSNFLGSRSVDKFFANKLGGRGLLNSLFGTGFVNKEIGAQAPFSKSDAAQLVARAKLGDSFAKHVIDAIAKQAAAGNESAKKAQALLQGQLDGMVTSAQKAAAAIQATLQAGLNGPLGTPTQGPVGPIGTPTKPIGSRNTAAPFTPPLPPPPLHPRPGLTAAQRNSFFDSAISSDLTRAGLLDSVKVQIGALEQVAGLISARLAATKDVTRRRNLEDQLLSVESQIRGDRAQVASDFIASLEFGLTKAQATAGFGDDLRALDKIQAALRAEIKATGSTLDLQTQLFDVAQQIKATKLSALSAKEFRQLGLDATGGDIVPGVKRLKKELGTVTDLIKGTSLDTKANEGLLARIRKTLSDSLVPQDVRSKMQSLLADLERQLQHHAGNLTKFRHVSSGALLAGISGLTPDQERALRSRFDQLGAGGTMPSRGPAFALAGAGATGSSGEGGSGGTTFSIGVLNLHGIQDVRRLQAELIKEAGRRSGSRRGPSAGR